METPESTLYLTSFAPLIQLWAGICLLFFYCELLDKSPFESARLQLVKLYKEIYDLLTTKYQVFIPDDNDVVVCYDTIPPQEDRHWGSFRTSIYCVAIFSFFYALILLIFTGVERNIDYGIYHQALQVTNSIALFYYLLNAVAYKTFWGQSKVFAICYALALGLYIPFHFEISKLISLGEAWSRTSICVYTLFTCIFGLLLIMVHLSKEWFVIYKCKRSIAHIKSIFNLWTKMPFSKGLTLIDRLKVLGILFSNMVRQIFKKENFEIETTNKTLLEKNLRKKVREELAFLNRKLYQESS